jgi:uncharacterized membrane protein
MTLKKYIQIRTLTSIVVAFFVSQSLILNNFFFPVMVVLISTLVLTYLRRQVKEIIADERDLQLGGSAALLAIQIYSWIAVIIMFVLYSFRNLNPSYEPVAITLAYSTCLLTISYSLIFKFYSRLNFVKNKTLYYVLAGILVLIGVVFTLRLFSGEDNWVCQNGQWVKHGQPDFPAPTSICK